MVQKALRDSEERFRGLYMQSPIAIELYDTEGRLIDVNPACLELFGIEDIREIRNFNMFEDPNLTEEAKTRIRQSQSASVDIVFDFDLVRRHNLYKTTKRGVRYLICKVTSWVNEQGQPGGYFLQIEDVTEQRLAQQSLQESQRKLATTLSNLPGMAYRCANDPDWTIEFVSEGIFALTGYHPEEMVGSRDISYGNIIHPDDRERIWDVIQAQLLLKEPYRLEYRIHTKQGEEKWVWEQGRGVYNRDGDLEALEGFITDISERVRAEMALEKVESRARKIIEHAPDGIVLLGPDGKMKYASPSARIAFGIGLEEEIDQDPASMTHPEDLPRVLAGLQEVIQNPSKVVSLQYRYDHRNGSWIWVESTFSNMLSEPSVEAIVINFRDISKRKKMEQELVQSEESFRQLFESESDALFLVEDKSGRLLQANRAATNLYGYSHDEFMQMENGDLNDGAESPQPNQDRPAQETGSILSIPLRWHRKKDGTRFPVEITSNLFLQNGRSVRISAVRDITLRKQAEEKIRKMNDELEQRVAERTAQLQAVIKELEAYSYSISHDLRAPLRGIDGWSMALLEDYGAQLDEQARAYLRRVRAETQRMGRLIDDVLQLSRLSRVEMKRARLNLSDMARVVFSQLKGSSADRKVELIVEDGLEVFADRNLMESMLTHLLGNALKFTSQVETARIELGKMDRENRPVYYVRDNGAGFDMAYAGKLFGAFQRMHQATEFPGNGIGLAIVQRIILRHGGAIWAEAAVNRGATFYFTLG